MFTVALIDPGVAILDDYTFDVPTIRHVNCQWLVSKDSAVIRCAVCIQHRSTLTVQSSRTQNLSADTSHSSHINYKYVS